MMRSPHIRLAESHALTRKFVVPMTTVKHQVHGTLAEYGQLMSTAIELSPHED